MRTGGLAVALALGACTPVPAATSSVRQERAPAVPGGSAPNRGAVSREDATAHGAPREAASRDAAPHRAVSRDAAPHRAVWTEQTIRLAEGDGSVEVLAGEGRVLGVALDRGGVVWALRNDRLGKRDGRGRESWRALPRVGATQGRVAPRLAVLDGSVAVVVAPADPEHVADVLVTHDGGETWWTIVASAPTPSPIAETIAFRRLALDGRGHLDLVVESVQGGSCTVSRTSVHRGPAMRAALPRWYASTRPASETSPSLTKTGSEARRVDVRRRSHGLARDRALFDDADPASTPVKWAAMIACMSRSVLAAASGPS